LTFPFVVDLALGADRKVGRRVGGGGEGVTVGARGRVLTGVVAVAFADFLTVSSSESESESESLSEEEEEEEELEESDPESDESSPLTAFPLPLPPELEPEEELELELELDELESLSSSSLLSTCIFSSSPSLELPLELLAEYDAALLLLFRFFVFWAAWAVDVGAIVAGLEWMIMLSTDSLNFRNQKCSRPSGINSTCWSWEARVCMHLSWKRRER
jgi:hypothetical protein